MEEVVISGTGLFTPPYQISNEELVASFNQFVDDYNKTAHEPLMYSSVDFIEKASGIKNRYVVEKKGILDIKTMRPKMPTRNNESASLQCDMAVAAAKDAFHHAGVSAADIDMVIVACSNMERPYPAIAIEVQHALGISGFAFDLNVACSSATFAIQVAMNNLAMHSAKGVLIVNPEICSAHLNFRNRDCHFIFGDACTAMVLQRKSALKSKNSYTILKTALSTSYSNNIRNNFGFLNVCDIDQRSSDDILFVQQGRKVFKEVVPMVSDFLVDHLTSANIPVSSLKRLWLHQANLSMNQLIAKKILGRDATFEESPSILDEYANTSSAGSIIAFHQYYNGLAQGDIGLISSFGAGYSVGSVIVQRN